MLENKEEIIFRIISSEQYIKVKGKQYVLRRPSNFLKLEAQELFEKTIRENRFNEWLTDIGCIQLLVSNNMCSKDIDANLKEIDKTIQDLKVKLYESIFTPDINKQIRQQLIRVKNKQLELLNIRHSYDHLTIRGYADMVKRQYIMVNTLYDNNNNRIWDDINKVDISMLEHITHKLLIQSIPVDHLREIARTEPWRGYWNIKKENVFITPVFDLTEEQKTLILYSKMYDSAYENSECPSEDIIEDNDMFDGWMIKQHRKREKDKMTKQVDDRLGRMNSNIQNAQEVFLPARSKKDIEKINDMNDFQSKAIKKQRRQSIEKHGKVKEQNLLDKKIELQKQANQNYLSRAKGK